MIPQNITKDHIIQALKNLDKTKWPKEHDSDKFDLIEKGETYPPKYVIRTANIYANGIPFDTGQFSGGDEANSFLKDLGFSIVRKKHVWIFQANPKRYDIEGELADNSIRGGTWLVSNYKNLISEGDIGLIWVAGEKRGIYAVIDILSNPALLVDTSDDNKYWVNKEEANIPKIRVKYRYQLKLNPPLLKSEIENIDGLQNLSILKRFQGTNFSVTNDEWKIIEREIAKRNALKKTSKLLEIQKIYSRNELKDQFNITDATINNGIFKPEGTCSIWLFITEKKPLDRTQYDDSFDGQVLLFEGQKQGRTDNLIIHHENDGNEIILFYRKKKEEYPNFGFQYLGRFSYESHTHEGTIEGKTRFVLFPLDLTLDDENGTIIPEPFIPSPGKEGKEKTRIQTYYERNPKLRNQAIKFHGTSCFACGFNFSKKYGMLGEGFIEIHHLKSHASIKGERDVDPKTDLLPVCSNCHRMIHKPRDTWLTIDEIKKLIQ